MKSMHYTIRAISVSLMYWFVDSTMHRFLYLEDEFEFIPKEGNELWMRIVIVSILIIFGIYADRHTKILLEKEKEKRVIFNATISSTQHILNNLLNQMQYFEKKIVSVDVFDERTKALYSSAIEDGKKLVEQLSAVDELTEESIKSSVKPVD